jgi:hypothetical protein
MMTSKWRLWEMMIARSGSRMRSFHYRLHTQAITILLQSSVRNAIRATLRREPTTRTAGLNIQNQRVQPSTSRRSLDG